VHFDFPFHTSNYLEHVYTPQINTYIFDQQHTTAHLSCTTGTLPPVDVTLKAAQYLLEVQMIHSISLRLFAAYFDALLCLHGINAI